MTDLIRTTEGTKELDHDGPGGDELPEPMTLAARTPTLAHESGVDRSSRAASGTTCERASSATASRSRASSCWSSSRCSRSSRSECRPYAYDELDLFNIAQAPTQRGESLFGTDLLGRDYLSRVIYGLRTSLWVAILVAGLTTLIGTTIGAIAGYYGGTVDNLLMRFTDLILTLPAAGRPADRVGVPRQRRPGPGRDHPGAALLDGSRANRARHLPLAAREGVRRGGEGRRRRGRPDHRPAHAARTRSGRSSSR